MADHQTDSEARTEFSSTVSGQMQNRVLVVTIDNPPVNATSAEVRCGLMAALAHLSQAPEAIAMVLTGAGRTFIGGADIREFGKPPVEPILPTVIAALEASDKPIIAALNGAALGGGLEVAMACHRRIAVRTASLGLPEVKLGIVPGAGGTQMLPRLIDAIPALGMIASGKPVTAAEALTIGLLDDVSGSDLIADAIDLAQCPTSLPPRRTSQLALPAFDATAYEAEAQKILKKARGEQAPAEAVRLVRMAMEVPFTEGLAEERATFLRLRDSEEAAALRHVFFAERSAGKVDGLEAPPLALSTIGIAGTGLMGCGIAVATLAAGYDVIALDQTIEAAENGRDRIAGLIAQSVKSGRLTQAEADAQLSRLTVTAAITNIAPADLVIEAVFDDLDVKIDLFRRLDDVLRPDAILATNTSYLDPDTIAAATAIPARVVGLHFFSPAHVMRLVEVVRCARSTDTALATALAFARKIRKLPVVTGVCEGFIGNRIFSAYRSEAERLIEEGALPQDIDRAMEDYGFPMGLFAVYDMAGLEIAWARRKRQAATRDPLAPYFEIPDRLCEAGRFGAKSGRGWYVYPDGRRTVDPDVTAMIEAYRLEKGLPARIIADAEIIQRLLAAMAREGDALLAEGIAARPGDIDIVLVNGYGFPARKGGPMFAASR